MDDLIYSIALTKIPNVGGATIKRILSLCEKPKNLFLLKRQELFRMGLSKTIVDSIQSHEIFVDAEKEIDFINKNNIQLFYINDENYSNRLRNCNDAPVILYGKGNLNLSAKKMISIVGTRKATQYGKELCENLIRDLSNMDITIVSGLAKGVDIWAHRQAVKVGLPTIGVMAHGFERLYPFEHRETTLEMMKNGGLLTDFGHYSKFHPGNFPARNRIVAGLSDATIVIESPTKGGSLITADIADSYHRDVFAMPGRVNDEQSKGCNSLIKNNKATLLENGIDLINFMGWNDEVRKSNEQMTLNFSVSEKAKKLIVILEEKNDIHIDELQTKLNMEKSELSSLILELEFEGLIQSLPGNRYHYKY